jgi:FlaA1/EpsC-like NDP-sugar epimerase
MSLSQTAKLITRAISAKLKWLLDRLAHLQRPTKQWLVFLVDVTALFQSIWIAYSLRIGRWILWDEAVVKMSAGALALMIPVFYFSGVYQTIFRYVGLGMLRTLSRAALIYGLLFFAIFTLIGIEEVPRTAGIIQPIIYFLNVVGARVLARFLMVDVLGRTQFGGEARRLLIYGAGNAGQQLASSLRSEPAMQVVGYVDDDKRLEGQHLDGTLVHWSANLPDVVKRTNASDILLALPSAGRTRRRKIVRQLSTLKIGVQTLPQAREIVGGEVTVSDIRPLQIEDLLGREPVTPDELLLERTIVGKAVLVTGAGGSIGSELCRQIVRLGADKLVLLETSEFSLYRIYNELKAASQPAKRPLPTIVPLLGSVTDDGRLRAIFQEHPVQTVYHAAAYKHVPLVEANPLEGIRNNIIGTYCLAQTARRFQVCDFILISTDKAVRPTNVMGATKRAAEQIVQAYACQNGQTRFSMVRFGNVLGSSGSVVPLFRQQIEAGGPVTLTDKRITRYFMTIPEAASLVIQAAGMARGGEVFVLDMGKPVKIAELARTMIQLSGLTVRDDKNLEGDIEIAEVGLRDGEKLHEELLIGSNPNETKHPRIRMAREEHLPWPELAERLAALSTTRNQGEAIAILRQLVPEFEHRRDNHEASSESPAMANQQSH